MNRRFALMGAATAIAVGGFAFKSGTGSPIGNLLVGEANAQDAANVDTSTIVEMVQGAEDAPVTIIEYSSFTCPHCAAFHEGAYQDIKKNYIDTGKVKLIYREVYFDRYGLWASMVARCGGAEKFFGISELMFKSQSDWARAGDGNAIVAELRKIGKMAGLEDATLDACMQDGEKAQTLVAWFQKNAEADEVNSTPSFIVNGKKVANQPYADFAALIDAELGG
ncbi:DsbA family protein [Sedimentitalea nanhaiensis]|uniref:Protein-disulfide isomerase n=1 Tax=Sedimentitalea nanhaiensis TaxID=999627 RepID=A0A1I7CIQ9_9RHOB|nr:DsbA family protein [Sedimentitalea nanhaiensis]SFT99321.1 Protein-disulfide isomerase [Sedimentitalea nanhaiensis]